MSVMLNDERTKPERRQICNRCQVTSRSHVQTLGRRPASQMAEDEEAIDVKLAFALAYLAIAPLILYVIHLWFWSPN